MAEAKTPSLSSQLRLQQECSSQDDPEWWPPTTQVAQYGESENVTLEPRFESVALQLDHPAISTHTPLRGSDEVAFTAPQRAQRD